MPDDFYDNDESDNSHDDSMDMEGENSTPEEKLGMVPLTFFKKDVEPGDTEKIEVVRIADGEAVIKCIYSEGDKEEKSEEPQMSEESAPSEAEDSMMA